MKNVHRLILSTKTVYTKDLEDVVYETMTIIPMTKKEINEFASELGVRPFEMIGDVRMAKVKDIFGNDCNVIAEYGSFNCHPDVFIYWTIVNGELEMSGADRMEGHPKVWYANANLWEWN